jgi:hypothetical protein
MRYINSLRQAAAGKLGLQIQNIYMSGDLAKKLQ